MPGKNGSLNHPTQGDSRNPMSVFCQPHPRTDEIKGINLILVHQHKADEHSLEILSWNSPKFPAFKHSQKMKDPDVLPLSGAHPCLPPTPSPSLSGMCLLNSKGPHKPCNQGSSGPWQLVWANPLICPQGPLSSDFLVSQSSPALGSPVVSFTLSPSLLLKKCLKITWTCIVKSFLHEVKHPHTTG